MDMCHAFVVIRNRKVEERYCVLSNNNNQTVSAERMACRLALDKYPDLNVFCDCRQAVDDFSKHPRVQFIGRRNNRLAHDTARRRYNIVAGIYWPRQRNGA